MRSVNVVFPESICAEIPILRNADFLSSPLLINLAVPPTLFVINQDGTDDIDDRVVVRLNKRMDDGDIVADEKDLVAANGNIFDDIAKDDDDDDDDATAAHCRPTTTPAATVIVGETRRTKGKGLKVGSVL